MTKPMLVLACLMSTAALLAPPIVEASAFSLVGAAAAGRTMRKARSPNRVFWADPLARNQSSVRRLDEFVLEPETNCTIPDANSTVQCAYVTQQEVCEIVSLVPYLKLYYCDANRNWQPVLFFGYFAWAVLLFIVLATTADDYFAPSLTQLSEWLNLKERVAGVTFLALGNGAADMFAVIAAVRVNAVDLAVGALQGGSMCVTTICTSGVIYATAGGAINAKGVFYMDLVFNGVSCLLIFYI
eukprot:SAG31_NODE_7946_length_1557_cov_1.395748_1_plen_241_part_10